MGEEPSTDLREFADVIRDMTQEEFLNAHTVPFLLVQGQGTEPITAFMTDRFEVGPGKPDPPTSPPGSPPDLGHVFPLRKTERNAFQNMILVGRASNNDIVLNHPSVSKMHAIFRPLPDGSGFTVTDSGSSFGTKIDNMPLEPQVAVPITNGQALVFGGAIRTVFFSPKSLFEHIRSLRFFKKL
jgi:hypothetical protein